MPPKASAPSKQGTKKAEKKPQVQLDDFFTRFLFKKKRNLNKKLQKIESLETTPAAELNEQQKEVLGSKKETLEKLNYFDKIQDLYYEAFTTKDDVDEDGQPPAKTEKAAPAQSTHTEAPAHKHVDEKEIHRRNARSVAELVSVSSFFNQPHNREVYVRVHGHNLKKLGNNFIDSVNSLWNSVTELIEVENQERTEEIAKVLENYLNLSESISAVANQTYSRLHEGVKTLANEEGFKLSKHVAPPIAEIKAHYPHAHTEEEPVRKNSEVKLVKNSKPASRKVSHQSPTKEDESHHHHHHHEEKHAPAEHKDFTKKPAKEIDPDEPQNTDDGWINVAGAGGNTGTGHRRGGRGRGRGGRGRDGDRRPDTRGEGGRNFKRDDDRGDRVQGEGDREDRGERRGGRGRDGERRHYDGERKHYDGERKHYDGERKQYDGERKQYDGERKQYDGERKQYDGERRERRGGYRGDGPRRPRPEGDRRPRDGDRPREQGNEGAKTESTK